MRMKVPIELSNVDVNPDFNTLVSQVLNSVITILNGQITFTENCAVKLMQVTFQSANVTQAVRHGLNKIPLGFILAGSQAATQVYNGNLAWTPQAIYLQATVATTVTVLVF